ncbi:hypothetical protein [Novosphingobium sp.]|uniref:hypothetical protein n=1 Tax=Novosphingobium sp. TaxID=1874826 RepID=UPI001EBC39D1|nr:hypothetical protein [Novosphingobium sp.]
MLRQIVDEDRLAGAIFGQDRLQRRALWPLVGENPRLDPVLCQLARTASLCLSCRLVRITTSAWSFQRVDRGNRARDRGLAVHFVVEETIEQAPDLRQFDRLARYPDCGSPWQNRCRPA